MHYQGTLKTWKDEQGFGFVTTEGKSDQVFVHIKNFSYRSRRPCEGDQLVYDIEYDEKQRAQAINIQLLHDFHRDKLRQKRFNQQEEGKHLLSKVAAYPFLIYLFILFFLHKISVWVLAYYVVINILTFVAYWNDKNIAHNNELSQRKARRTPEDTLHLCSVLGGWIGALIAQLKLRHKSQKQAFRQIFWITVIIHIVLLTALVITGWATLPFLHH